MEIIHEPPRLEVEHAEASHEKFQSCFKPSPAVSLREGVDKMWSWVLNAGRGYHPVSFDGLELNQGKLPRSWATDNDFITDNVRIYTDNESKKSNDGQ